MAVKITDLDPALPFTGAEITPLVQNEVTRRSTLAEQADWMLKTYSGFLGGTGAPDNAQGNNGNFYFRSDGGALTTIYHKRSGEWVGIV